MTFEKIHNFSFEGVLTFGESIEKYEESYKIKEIQVESAINFVSVILLYFLLINVEPSHINKTAFLNLFEPSERKLLDELINNYSEENMVKSIEYLKTIIFDPETQNEIYRKISIIKQSKEWSDLAYYFIAEQYYWGLLNNQLEKETNCRIGMDLMNQFASIGNPYALSFLKWLNLT